jgi:hypothetical protein
LCEILRQPASAQQALAAVKAGLRYLAAADATELTVTEQADCLRGLAAAEAVHLAARSSVLRAFTSAEGYSADGQMTPRAWLRWQTRITGAAASAATGWSRRLGAHPELAAALSAGEISPSFAREMCDWTDRLPQESRDDADRILLGAAADGAELTDLSGLAEEIYRRCAPPDLDDGDDRFAQRWLRLTPHFRGHARIDGDLTPRAAAALRAVLDALAKKRGPEDERTTAQREHDALEEACVRVVGAGLPDRAGQPTQIQLAMPLQQLMGLPGAAAAAAHWTGHLPPAPPGAECDASIVPMVTGHVDTDVLEQLAGQLRPAGGATDVAGMAARAAGGATDVAGMAARRLTIADAVRLLSGPPGLVSYLRTSQLSGPAASVSLPLDVGAVTETVPPHLRRAVILRAGGHCEAPGCDRGEAWCHVHHIVPRSEGGTTSLENSFFGCDFHHLIMIHRWGWKIFLNSDGTTTMVSPDGDRVLRSHRAPGAA